MFNDLNLITMKKITLFLLASLMMLLTSCSNTDSYTVTELVGTSFIDREVQAKIEVYEDGFSINDTRYYGIKLEKYNHLVSKAEINFGTITKEENGRLIPVTHRAEIIEENGKVKELYMFSVDFAMSSRRLRGDFISYHLKD